MRQTIIRGRGSVVLKSPREIEIMRRANRHVAEIIEVLVRAAVPGASTWDLDQLARAEMNTRGVKAKVTSSVWTPDTTLSRNEHLQRVLSRPQDKVAFEGAFAS